MWSTSRSCARRTNKTSRRRTNWRSFPFPTEELFERRLDEFDLIIFDRAPRRGILQAYYFSSIARRIEQGGALLITAGETEAGLDGLYRTSLAGILPSQPTGAITALPYRPAPTALGTAPSGRARTCHRRSVGDVGPARSKPTRRRSNRAARLQQPRRCSCSIAPAKDALRNCGRTSLGCGRAVMMAAARTANCCAASRTG